HTDVCHQMDAAGDHSTICSMGRHQGPADRGKVRLSRLSLGPDVEEIRYGAKKIYRRVRTGLFTPVGRQIRSRARQDSQTTWRPIAIGAVACSCIELPVRGAEK